MRTYTPDPAFVKATLAAIHSPVPFFASLAIKAVPTSMKESAVSLALAQVVPLSLSSIAITQDEGARVTLTTHGELKAEVKAGMLRRIAAWFIPSEVKEVSAELQKDVVRLARAGYATDSLRLELAGEEVVLVVLNTSAIKVTADTAIDLFFASSERLMSLKDVIMKYVPRR